MQTVYRIVWDAEPKMGGGFHEASIGKEFYSIDEAKAARDILVGFRERPGIRIQKRKVTMWEAVPE